MQCPECKSQLASAATYCGCGWKKPTKRYDDDDTPRCYCAHDGCPNRAAVKIETKTGWANLCHAHYSKHYADQANAKCATLKLTTTDQRREWCKAQLRKSPMFANLERLYQTEPGEDWDEPTA